MTMPGELPIGTRSHVARMRRVLTVGAALAALLSGVAGSARGDDLRQPPPWKHLTPAETGLWRAQGVDLPSTQLLGQAAQRSAGETTVLNAVVILVDFPDFPADRESHPKEYYEELFFSRGVHPTGSVADFLWESSFGRLDFRGEVRGWYTASQRKTYYTAAAGGLGYYPFNSQRLAEEAIELADPSINYARFDSDGPDAVPDSGDDDETVDAVIVIHAGQGREGGNLGLDEFVSARWWLRDDLPVDGVFGRDFSVNPETGDIGIYLHELGHLLGLPDLYPTKASIQGSSFGLGMWSLMAGGLLLGDGVYPGDFDAWSKVQLGFVDVRRIFMNQRGLVIPPVETGGLVYRLWFNGLGDKEYFLVENRQKMGLDTQLPGSGLLIYHVDDRIDNNNNPDYYHVALEQADGLYQLEARYGSASPGDPGDPFTAGTKFTRYSDPGSRAYDGSDTFVSVFNISGPDESGAMTADVNVEASAAVTLRAANLVEMEGNGDGLVGAGETAGVVPELFVDRMPAFDLRVALSSASPYVEIVDREASLGTVATGHTATPESPLRVRISPSLPTDPYGVPVTLRIDWSGDTGRDAALTLGVGTQTGRSDDFETLEHGWTHSRLRPSAKDQWLYTTLVGEAASAGFKCGNPGRGFLAGVDAVLESPPVLLPPDAELRFSQLVDIPLADSLIARAGGMIEISVNGGDWSPVAPEGGYPARYFGSNEERSGAGSFAGRLLDGTFHERRVDLASYSGWVRVRFRFLSDIVSTKGEGWHIDNVRIQSAVTPVRLVEYRAEIDGEDVALSWRLADPLPMLVRWREGTEFASARIVGDGWMPATESGTIRDAGAGRLLPATYWLEGLERDGTGDSWGPWTVERAGSERLRARLLANPVRGDAIFTWNAPPPPGAAVRVFDARGRLVAECVPAPGSARAVWTGRERTGRDAPPGLYFARVVGTADAPIRIVRLP